ncbi:hypothetical protein HPB51_007750 [Rhipicephalus microplus]|uniref:G-protein coupled receptors family 1 profile domain-containing protein n=1 Tax=Rhipicephalus microplus TaxID=6941 RepID=A0A9J6EG66_RHIMP|nr:hypothetical protein HPB51_007750 [Rhipicephalus microplus]
MYRDALYVQLQLTDLTPGVKKRRWRQYCDRIEYTANRLWSRELASLRAQRPTEPRQSGVVHSCSDVVLPDYVHNTLALGPKFAVDRGRSAPELLSMVRSVAGHASPEDSDRCISEGVDVLLRGKPTSNSLPVRKTTKFLRDNELCVVPSDKEGGFAVLPNSLYLEKAVTAIESVFKCCTDIRLDRSSTESYVTYIQDVLTLCRNVDEQMTESDKVVKMLVTVVLMFAVCWLPIHMMNLVVYFDRDAMLPDTTEQEYLYIAAFFSCHWFSMANSFVNPIIYCFMSDNFRVSP